MKNFKLLNTDFYQISMGFAYVVEGINKQTTGFEGFIRHIKAVVNPNADFYVFDGETEVKEYIETIRNELKDPELVDSFIELIEPKITAPNKDELIQTFRNNWEDIDTDFEYSIVPNGTIVLPYVPVFQFSGDKMIGQMIETYVTNIYNGRTGLATIKYLKENGFDNISNVEYNFLVSLMNNEQYALDQYTIMLDETAEKFRDSTDKILLEAAFRRAPSFEAAQIASKIALDNGWSGTSNVSIVLDNLFPMEKVGGTMAHSWVMCFNDERNAYKAWDRIFPGTTMLIDTYDVINAANMIKDMIDSGEITPPNELRIDSDPLDEYAQQVDAIFDGKVNIYVSGDMTVEKFEDFDNRNIPFSKAMAGTKYVYNDKTVEKLNCGFVYKIVEYIDENGNTIRPEKKSTGKSNYPGLKTIIYNEETDTLNIHTNAPSKFGFKNMDKVTPKTTVNFIQV
jgi:nicotinate phosphoribosyltransferase